MTGLSSTDQVNVVFEPIPEEGTDPDSPAVNPFTDVAEGAYYYDAVLWAVEKGVTNGRTATTFAPQRHLYPGPDRDLPVQGPGQVTNEKHMKIGEAGSIQDPASPESLRTCAIIRGAAMAQYPSFWTRRRSAAILCGLQATTTKSRAAGGPLPAETSQSAIMFRKSLLFPADL